MSQEERGATQCGDVSGPYRCNRPAGHKGSHGTETANWSNRLFTDAATAPSSAPPRKPTLEMLAAAHSAWRASCHDAQEYFPRTWARLWRAMYDAAPAPSADESDAFLRGYNRGLQHAEERAAAAQPAEPVPTAWRVSAAHEAQPAEPPAPDADFAVDVLCDGDPVALVKVPRGVIRHLRAENERQAREIDQWKAWPIAEIAARNPSVLEYMRHWEGRAERAEIERDALRECLAELVSCKDLKDMLDLGFTPEYLAQHGGELAELRAEYERRKPLAWKAARAKVGQ